MLRAVPLLRAVNDPAPHASQAVVFVHTVESVFQRALKDDLTPSLVARLRAMGLDLERKLLPAYPVTLWNAVLEETVKTLSPTQPVPEAARRLGERMIEGYRSTLVGQAVLAMARVLGPRRALLRSRQNWRSGNNYSEVTVEELAPTDFRLTFNEAGVSRWVSQGLLHAGLTFAGARGLEVAVETFTETDAVYRITWQ